MQQEMKRNFYPQIGDPRTERKEISRNRCEVTNNFEEEGKKKGTRCRITSKARRRREKKWKKLKNGSSEGKANRIGNFTGAPNEEENNRKKQKIVTKGKFSAENDLIMGIRWQISRAWWRLSKWNGSKACFDVTRQSAAIASLHKHLSLRLYWRPFDEKSWRKEGEHQVGPAISKGGKLKSSQQENQRWEDKRKALQSPDSNVVFPRI